MDDFLERVTQNGIRTPEISTPRQSYHLNTFTPRRVLPTQLSFSRDYDFNSSQTSKSSSCVSSGIPSPTEHRFTDVTQLMDLDGRALMNRLSEKRLRAPSSPIPLEVLPSTQKTEENNGNKFPDECTSDNTAADGYISEDEATVCEDKPSTTANVTDTNGNTGDTSQIETR